MASVVRESTRELLDYLREMINDPVSGSETFTDNRLQDFLDLHRTDARQMLLFAADTVNNHGTVEWFDFYAQIPFWEADAVFQSPTWQYLTPTRSDFLSGNWSFATSQTLPVRITGKYFDMNAAAIDALTRMESLERGTFNFSADGLSIQRLQKLENIRSLRKEYERRQPMRTVRMVRTDVSNPATESATGVDPQRF